MLRRFTSRCLLGFASIAVLTGLALVVNDVGKQSASTNTTRDSVVAIHAAFPTGAVAIHDTSEPDAVAAAGHHAMTTSHAGAPNDAAGTKINRTEVAAANLTAMSQVPS